MSNRDLMIRGACLGKFKGTFTINHADFAGTLHRPPEESENENGPRPASREPKDGSAPLLTDDDATGE